MKKTMKRGVVFLLLAALLAGLFPAAMAATVPEVKSATVTHFWVSTYVGEMYTGVSYDYYFSYMDLNIDGNAAVGYCMNPYYGHTTTPMTPSDWDNWRIEGGGVNTEQAKRLGWALVYGAPGGNSTTEAKFATAAVVWDILAGWDNSSSASPFGEKLKYIKDRSDGYDHYTGAEEDKVDGAAAAALYQTIWNKVKTAGTIPSFTVDKNNLPKVQTVTLKPSGSSYTATVTDTRDVLADYHFHCDVPGVTFARSGNTLTITATAEAARTIGTGGVIASSRGSSPDNPVEPWEACVVLSGSQPNGNVAQPVLAMAYPTDPVPCFFKLTAEEQNGKIEIVKATNTGRDLGGWQIGIYTDAACSSPIAGSPFVTTADGHILVDDLKAGTYYAQELNGSHGYWTGDDAVKTVTVEAGKTATVTFSNVEYGRVKIVKTTNTGRDLAGWKIGIYSDPDCTQPVSGSPFVTGEDGTITTGAWAGTAGVNGCLLPGTYYAQEIGGGDDYWSRDPEVKTVTVVAGETATVTFSNIQNGRVKIVKTMDTDGPLDGWQFMLTGADRTEYGPYTSAEDGTITTANLLPGIYTVEEIIPDNSLYYCKSDNPQTVEVKPGETATVSFTNALRPGKITVHKVDMSGQPLTGAEFLLEWSEDGVIWNPVVYSEKADVVKGGCTSEGITDGCLVSGADGIVVFENLYPGLTYRLTETAAPAGYQLLEGYAFEGPLPQETLTVTLTVVNAPVFRLPETGGNGLAILPVLAALCWCLCFGLGFWTFRGKKRG